MKIRVPFGWFWYGDQQYGTPEVESGTIAAANPTPPAVMRLPHGTPLPNDGPTMDEEDLEPYQTPAHVKPQTIEEKVDELERRLREAESANDRFTRGPDTNRGGR